EIASIRLTKANTTRFIADEKTGFDAVRIAGDAERIAGHAFRLRVTGIDPQMYLPAVDLPAGETSFVLEMRLRVLQQPL
ncbi:MAG: hypothetical protein QOG51_644, partial [Verrucomicrobiota bacterium]